MTWFPILLALQLTATPLAFDEAKAHADSYEDSLAPSAKAALVRAQGIALRFAFESCGHLAESPISPFTVVARVNEIGTTDKTWLRGGSALARCVERKLATAALPVSGGRSFYTSYEFTFEP